MIVYYGESEDVAAIEQIVVHVINDKYEPPKVDSGWIPPLVEEVDEQDGVLKQTIVEEPFLPTPVPAIEYDLKPPLENFDPIPP